MRAVDENRLPVVHTLLETNATDLNATNDHGATALHHAAAKGYLEIARLLIADDADLERTDREGQTPLMIAIRHGHDEIVDLINRTIDRKALPES